MLRVLYRHKKQKKLFLNINQQIFGSIGKRMTNYNSNYYSIDFVSIFKNLQISKSFLESLQLQTKVFFKKIIMFFFIKDVISKTNKSPKIFEIFFLYFIHVVRGIFREQLTAFVVFICSKCICSLIKLYLLLTGRGGGGPFRLKGKVKHFNLEEKLLNFGRLKQVAQYKQFKVGTNDFRYQIMPFSIKFQNNFWSRSHVLNLHLQETTQKSRKTFPKNCKINIWPDWKRDRRHCLKLECISFSDSKLRQTVILQCMFLFTLMHIRFIVFKKSNIYEVDQYDLDPNILENFLGNIVFLWIISLENLFKKKSLMKCFNWSIFVSSVFFFLNQSWTQLNIHIDKIGHFSIFQSQNNQLGQIRFFLAKHQGINIKECEEVLNQTKIIILQFPKH